MDGVILVQKETIDVKLINVKEQLQGKVKQKNILKIIIITYENIHFPSVEQMK